MKKMALGTTDKAPAPKLTTTTATRPPPATTQPTTPAETPAKTLGKTAAARPTQQRAPAGIVIRNKAEVMAAFNNAVKNRLVRPVNVQITSVPVIRIREGTVEYDAKVKKSVFRPARR